MGNRNEQTANEGLEISFAHPRGANTYEATVVPTGTLGECLEVLVSEGFLEPETEAAKYLGTLRRTNTALGRDLSFVDAKVVAGDVITLSIAGKGGR